MPENKIYILTGPIQTGKTTSLVNWSINREDVFGILAPVVDGKRVFMNTHTREQFPMEAVPGELQTLIVGRFVFSQTNFNKAIQVIEDSIPKKDWLVIDEIGPLELRGNGFADALKGVLAVRDKKILLVVREGWVEKVKKVFKINDSTTIHTISDLTN